MPAIDLGTDIGCDPQTGATDTFDLVSGRDCLVQALLRRYETERGELIDDPDYGLDLTKLVGLRVRSTAQLLAWQQSIAAEAMKDERVQRASCRIAFDAPAETLTVRLAVETAAGPFRLVIEASALSLTLLEVS
jgi:phage baseplate assembly protein W